MPCSSKLKYSESFEVRFLKSQIVHFLTDQIEESWSVLSSDALQSNFLRLNFYNNLGDDTNLPQKIIVSHGTLQLPLRNTVNHA